jgi:hypothetical protein
MSDTNSASKASSSPGPSIAPLAKYKLVFLGDQGVGTPLPACCPCLPPYARHIHTNAHPVRLPPHQARPVSSRALCMTLSTATTRPQ